MIASTGGRRGQITRPSAIRRYLKLQEGDRILFARRGDEIILQPLQQTLTDLRGSVPVSGEQDFEAICKQVIKAHALIPNTQSPSRRFHRCNHSTTTSPKTTPRPARC